MPHPNDEIESAEGYRDIVAEGLKFIPYAPVIFASAKTGYHVKTVLETALKIAEMRHLRVPTARLNEVVQDAIRRHNPTVIHTKPLKIFYATQARVNPPTFIFFVNDPEGVHFSYERYLENRLREAFSFNGTAIRLEFQSTHKRRHQKERTVACHSGRTGRADGQRTGSGPGLFRLRPYHDRMHFRSICIFSCYGRGAMK